MIQYLVLAVVTLSVAWVVLSRRTPAEWAEERFVGRVVAARAVIGAADHEITIVIDADQAPSGDVWALDAMNTSVWHVDEDGRLEAVLGRKGHGPGEFNKPVAIAVSTDGARIAVADAGLQRLTVIDTVGNVLEEIRFEGMQPQVGWDSLGRLYLMAAPPSRGAITVRRYDDRSPPVEVAAVPFDYRSLYKAPWQREAMTCPDCGFAVARDGRFAFGADGIKYELSVFDPSADTMATWRAGAKPIPYTESERESLRKVFENGIAPPPPHLEERLKYKRTIYRMAFDELGRLWVQRNPTPAGSVFDIFSTDGIYLGSIRYAQPGMLMAVRNSNLLFVRPGSPGRTEMVELRIEFTDAVPE